MHTLTRLPGSPAGNGSDDNKVTPATTRTPSSSAAPQPSAVPVPLSPAEPRNTPSPYPTPAPTPDPYFLHFDPRREHQDYKQAQHRLEETHREKVTKVCVARCYVRPGGSLAGRAGACHQPAASGAQGRRRGQRLARVA